MFFRLCIILVSRFFKVQIDLVKYIIIVKMSHVYSTSTDFLSISFFYQYILNDNNYLKYLSEVITYNMYVVY